MKNSQPGKRIAYLQNVISGNHQKRSHGWTPDKVERKEGEVWTDSDGKEWEIRNGIKWKTSKLLDVINEAVADHIYLPHSCPKCNNPMKKKLDKKMWFIHKMCFECVIAMEHQMKIDGTYNEYERNKVQNNMEAWFKDFKQMIEEGKRDSLKQKFVDGNGKIEDFWEDPQSYEELSALIDPIMEDIEQKIFGKKLEAHGKDNEHTENNI